MVTLAEWHGGTLPSVSGSSVTIGTGSGLLAEHLLIAHDGNAATYAEWTWDASTKTAVRYYVELPSSWPSSSTVMAALRNSVGNGFSARHQLAGTSAPGNFRLVATGGAQVATSGNGAVSTSTLYRVEMQVDHTTDEARLAVWDTDDTTLIWDSDWISSTWNDQTTGLRLGATVGASPVVGTHKFAHVLVTDDVSGWIGPHVIDPDPDPDPEDPEVKVAIWDGSDLIYVIPSVGGA